VTARWLLPAALAILAVAFEGYLLADRPSRTYASIKIRWADEVAEARRIALERDLGLQVPQADGGQLWAYRLYAPTTGSLSRVVSHAAVADTAGLRRSLGLHPGSPVRRTDAAGHAPAALGPVGVAASAATLQPASVDALMPKLLETDEFRSILPATAETR
jgi:hypothetical protein